MVCCTLADNVCTGQGQGGAVLCGACSFAEFTGCTFVHDTGSDGGALHAVFTTLRLYNCVIAFGQAGPLAACGEGSDVHLQCSDLYGSTGGDWVGDIAWQLGQAGNISADPLFCDWTQGDCYLSEGSPCAAFSPPNPEWDLIGAWRLLRTADGRKPRPVGPRSRRPRRQWRDWG